MQGIHTDYRLDGIALQLAGVLVVMLICGIILGVIGKQLLGKWSVNILGVIGLLIGLYLALKLDL